MEENLALTHLDPLVAVSTPHPELLGLTMLLVLRGLVTVGLEAVIILLHISNISSLSREIGFHTRPDLD